MELTLKRGLQPGDAHPPAAGREVPPGLGDPRRAGKSRRREDDPDCARQGEMGTSPGVNIAPGSDDDGWIVPQPVTLSDGTRVQLYKDGEALHAAYDAIGRARRRVCLESYIFASDDTGRAFADLLAEKARRGLSVFVLYDGFGSIASDKAMFRRMRDSGVRLQEFHPIRPWENRFGWRPFNRDHRKLLVIDDDIAGLGGLNVGAEYAGSWVVRANSIGGAIGGRLGKVVGNAIKRGLAGDVRDGDCELWRDNAVGLQGPGARVFQAAFARTWNYALRGGRIRRAELAHNLDGSGGDMGLLASVPTLNSPLKSSLYSLMRGAKESILITMAYFVPDDDMVKELCGAARRGVRVRLMLPGRSDVKLVQTAARSFYEKLMSHGVEIYERQSVVLHSKTMVIDGQTSVIGSCNLDYRSIEYNLELSAVFRSKELGAQMQELFENDVRYAERMNLAEWRRRPYMDKFVQWAVSRARYLL